MLEYEQNLKKNKFLLNFFIFGTQVVPPLGNTLNNS